MERIKYLFIYLASTVIFFTANTTMAEDLPLSVLVTPQNIAFENCTKQYNLAPEKLYYLTISSINANRFEVGELQSKTGYILFSAAGKDFLASIIKLGTQKSLLKITPTNGVYYFAPGIVLNIFKYIDLNIAAQLTQIKPD